MESELNKIEEIEEIQIPQNQTTTNQSEILNSVYNLRLHIAQMKMQFDNSSDEE